MADDNNPTPPPLNNPYQQPPGGTAGGPPYASDMSEEEIDEALERNRPTVSSGATKLIVIAFGALAFIIYILYSILYSGTKTPPPKKDVTTPSQGATPVTPPPPTQIITPVTPPAPPPAPPEPPAPPPPPPPPPPMPEPEPAANTAPSTPGLPAVSPNRAINFDDKEMQRRLRSGMMVSDNDKADAARADESRRANDSLNASDSNRSFSDRITGRQTERISATKLLNLDHTIAQGKIIEAVTESAINTDLPAPIRAIVSRDVYAESGHRVLIPKGSRLIGEYNTDVLRGQARVFIVWSRILEPDGTDVAIGSPGVDALGRAGMAAQVDNKFLNLFSTALLNSVLSIGTAVVVNGVTHGNSTSTTTSPNGTTTTGSPGAIAAGQSIQQFGNATQGILQDFIDLRPTLTVDQGTRVNVFVNRDVYFPEDGSGAVFIQ